ncbi:MAG: hypothetical protein PHF30_04590 [Bacilli bacterium]|nr:hypothetical protein [Bacilli bacterium]
MKEKIEKIRKKAIEILPSILNIICSNIDLNSIIWFKFRIKSIESYIKRMKRLNSELNEVDDLIGFCIVAETEEKCYELLSQIKNINEINIIDVKDYIKSPCGINSYQAIHIKYKYKDFFGEIQIKTEEMYDTAKITYDLYKENLDKTIF